MDTSWDAEMKEGWLDDPILEPQIVDRDLYGGRSISDEMVRQVFLNKSRSLKTWGRHGSNTIHAGQGGNSNQTWDPHWIATQGGTTVHRDPSYPRYSHHLVLRADSGQFLRGRANNQIPVEAGLFYILDSHSPHQLIAERQAVYVAVSLDNHQREDINVVLPILSKYAKEAQFEPER